MKRALVIRNVASHDVPLDSLDNACVQAFTANGFITEIAVHNESEIRHQLMQTHARASATPVHRQQYPNYYRHSYKSNGASYRPVSATTPFDAVLFRAGGLPAHRVYPVIKMIRTISKQIFLCVFSAQLIEYPMGRYQCFEEGASMVTSSFEDVHRVMKFIGSCGTDQYSSNSNANGGDQRSATYTCPFCEKPGFTEDQLWRHCPMYHINEKNTEGVTCPICREYTRGPFQVHLHNGHGPPGRGEMTSEFHMAESMLYSFALVVCHNKKYNSFLLVQEFANSGYWLPGGRIDSGENPAEAAIRETKEEAGIDIRLTGMIKIEYHPKKDRSGSQYVRMRFIFYAEPIDCDQLPKSIPDYESVGATWCSADQVASLPLRGPEPAIYFAYIASAEFFQFVDILFETTLIFDATAVFLW
uniref:Nudix hydrolase domain-containing protein n=1 Tax=Globisporangium ultimum (strain ATCC 200006 / CBS 805.95 / DAOM BR144) TaxID=431595 RepID=K3WVN0_GLOUD